MTYRGHVKNGQITLDEPARLPEGAAVKVQVVEEVARQPARQHGRREILQMPLEKRRQLLTKQSERLAEYYEADIDRSDWQGGDILE